MIENINWAWKEPYHWPVFWVSNKVLLRQACSATATSQKIEISIVESLDIKCSVALPHGAMGFSAVCDCGISWSCSLTLM